MYMNYDQRRRRESAAMWGCLRGLFIEEDRALFASDTRAFFLVCIRSFAFILVRGVGYGF